MDTSAVTFTFEFLRALQKLAQSDSRLGQKLSHVLQQKVGWDCTGIVQNFHFLFKSFFVFLSN